MVNPHLLKQALSKTTFCPRGDTTSSLKVVHCKCSLGKEQSGPCRLGLSRRRLQHEKPMEDFLSQQEVKVLTGSKETEDRSRSLSMKVPKVNNRVTQNEM